MGVMGRSVKCCSLPSSKIPQDRERDRSLFPFSRGTECSHRGHLRKLLTPQPAPEGMGAGRRCCLRGRGQLSGSGGC